MTTRSDLQRLAPTVLTSLQHMAPLPSHGVVAGQAVASLFYQALGLELDGPINDIDVFVAATLPPQQRQVVHTNTKLVASSTQPKLSQHNLAKSAEHEYEAINVLATRGPVQMLRTYRRGMLNYTLISTTLAGGTGYLPLEVGHALVNGFDLNCVGVGIDLHSKEVVCSQAFLDFLQHRQIMVQSAHTPGYTLIRLAKKSTAIGGATCDLVAQSQVLADASHLYDSAHWDTWNNTTITTFGSKYWTMANGLDNLPAIETIHEKNQQYRFCYGTQSDIAHKLIQGWLTVDPEHKTYLQSFFINNFPNLRAQVGTPQWEAFLHCARDGKNSHAQVLHYAYAAIGKDNMFAPLPDFDDVQSSAFFYNQPITDVTEVANIYSQWNAYKRQQFNSWEGKAGEVLAFERNPKQYFSDKILQQGLGALHRVEHESIQHFEDIVRNADVRNAIIASFPRHAHLLEASLNTLSPQDSAHVMHLLAPIVLPHFPSIPQTDNFFHEAKAMSLIWNYAADLNVSASDEFWLHFVLNEPEAKTQAQRGWIEHILGQLDDTTLFQPRKDVWRTMEMTVVCLLSEQHTDILLERMSHFTDQQWDMFVDNAHKCIDVRYFSEATEAKKAVVSKLNLLRTVQPTEPVHTIKRKM